MYRKYGILFLFFVTGYLYLDGFSPGWTQTRLNSPFDNPSEWTARELYYFSTLWYQKTEENQIGDFNGDTKVDSRDLVEFLTLHRSSHAVPADTYSPDGTPLLTPILPLSPTVSGTYIPPASVSPSSSQEMTPVAIYTGTATPTPSLPSSMESTPPSPLETTIPTDSSSPPANTATPTATMTFPPGFTPSPVESYPASTQTVTNPTSLPEWTRNPNATNPPATEAGESTPVLPQPTNTPLYTPTPPLPVRQWNLHRYLPLFSQPVELPPSSQIASNDVGYVVYTYATSGEVHYISFDRFGRIFRRSLPMPISDYSGLVFVDGGETFGRFFENPSDTRRFVHDRFDLYDPTTEPVNVDHLAADAIAWAFGGGKEGSAMAILRYPNLITVHSLDSEGGYITQVDITSSASLPTRPVFMKVTVSGDIIGILYSSNYNSVSDSITPLFLWLVQLDGTLITETPHTIQVPLIGEAFVGDDNGRFFLIGESLYGPRFYRASKNGFEFEKVVPVSSVVDAEWQDERLWILNNSNHSLYGFDEEGQLLAGPVAVFPPGWTNALQWLELRKSGPDLGTFFTDPASSDSVFYMQIEAGAMVTPTPTPGSGLPSGATTTIELSEDNEIEMGLIQAGTYQGGSPEDEKGRFPNESPRHSVTITSDFYMSQYEVTNRQYRQFDPGHTGSPTGNIDLYADDLPVIRVTWDEAKAFCDWLSEQTEKNITLPTEAEWEYACRAGTTTRRFWGNDPDDDHACAYANAADISAASEFTYPDTFACDDGYAGTAPVGSFLPNAFGLYDMMGNVWEWCEDWFALYPEEAVTDPTGPSRGYSKVIRGGSWQDSPDRVRSAMRSGPPPDRAHPAVGFRIVMRKD